MNLASDRLDTNPSKILDEKLNLTGVSVEGNKYQAHGTNGKASSRLLVTELVEASSSTLKQIIRNTSDHIEGNSSFLAHTTSGNFSDPAYNTPIANHSFAIAAGNVTTMNMSSNLTSAVEMMAAGGNGTSDDANWYDMPKLDNFMDILGFFCSGAVILGGLVPYIPQYLKIKNTGSTDGFSSYVCLTLLLSSILRIAFWFGHRFELPLLYQAFVMIAGMLAMMELCIRVRNRNTPYIIGARPLTSRARRSIIGKILSDTNTPNNVPYQNGLNNESTPIYSVSSSSSTPSPTSSLTSKTVALSPTASKLPQSEPQATPYHQQESIEIETERNSGHVSRGSSSESATQYNSNSFSDLESPILSNIHEPAPSQFQSEAAQTNNIESQVANHSYSNGYISNQRKHRLGLVKWFNASNFWDWDDLLSYVKFLFLFTIILGMLTYFLINNHVYIEGLGFVSVFTESMLGMPQLIRNCVKKSTRGMSVEMVIMWLSGDLFKTLYFILRKSPVQFIMCGSIQVTVDILILIQVFWYRRPKVTYSKLPKST